MKTRKNMKEAWDVLQIPGKPHREQIEAMNDLLDGRDTMVVAPTSFGKSAIYLAPALINGGKGKWTLVIEPTLALIADQVSRLQGLGIAAGMLTSRNYDDHCSILRELAENKTIILYATPERLRTVDFLAAVNENPPWLIAVDEAHCVLDWGYTFRKDYLRIKDFTKKLKHHPVIAAFTATAPPEYRDAICRHLGMKMPCIYTSSLERGNIILLEENCSGLSIKKRLSRVKYNIKKYRKDGRTVIYCSTRKHVDMVSNCLSKQFPGEVVKCHAYMDANKRERHEMQFISGSKPIMVATTAFGMGINVPDIRLVLHFNLPLSTIDYYQQIGRAGRDGRKSHAMLLYSPDDIALNQYILKKEALSEGVRKWLSDRLEEMASLAESGQCLMQQLLKSLGEDHPTTCRHCTNCQRARR